MPNVRSIRAILFPLFLSLSLFQVSCSVFGPVGGWFSRGYENTVAYFNAYYNAKRLFDEAEAEVLAARSAVMAKTAPGVQAPVTGSTTKQKFTTVIDKCSNILSFYPESSIVEDALFLIGKSYYYQDEFVKAERKFTELIAKDPNGSLSLESQLWLLKSLQHLRRYNEAQTIGTQLAASADTTGEDAIAGEAYSILGEMAADEHNADLAIDSYAKSVNAFRDGSLKATTQLKIGDLYYSIQDYRKASAAYLDVRKYSPDTYVLYHAQLGAATCESNLGQFDAGLDLLRAMEADYRFIDYRSSIRLELGETLDLAGHTAEAVEVYSLVDSLYGRTEQGAKAAFELGKLLQYRLDDYAGAKRAYNNATVGGPVDLTHDAQKKVAGLDQYFSLQSEFFKADSILFALDVDSLWIKHDSTGAPVLRAGPVSKVDSAKNGAPNASVVPSRDTLASVKSSAIVEQKGTRAYVYLPRPPKDTLIAQMARCSFRLGELFYTELEVPDSTFYWMRRAMEFKLDSTRTPRALYVLAEVAHADSSNRFGDAKELYQRIIDEYPKSTYAEEARVALGKPRTVKQTDPAIQAYASADSLAHAGLYTSALDSLNALVTTYTHSPLVPKSYYMMAWIYENNLNIPDSAVARYRTIAERFAKTEYGEAAARRIPPAGALLEEKTDSSAVHPTAKSGGTHADSLRGVLPDSLNKTMSAPSKGLVKDSTHITTPEKSPGSIMKDSVDVIAPAKPPRGVMKDSVDVIAPVKPPQADTIRTMPKIDAGAKPAVKDTLLDRKAKESMKRP